jgi:hypothetical protein
MRSLGVTGWLVTICLVAPVLNCCARTALPVGCCPSATVQDAAGRSYSAQPAADFRPLTAAHVHERPNPADSWMTPDAATQDLLYVTDVKTATVYSYPHGKLEGKLKGFYQATGMCVDKTGDVFIVDLALGRIFEYAHGGTKRLATLVSPTRDPSGCSIDPTTGNLAVGSLGFGSNGSVAIFKNARGQATTYQSSSIYQFYFCGYDDKGNLFADGLIEPGGTGDTAFAELPKGGHALKTVTLDHYIGWPGGVQWDGKYVAVGDQATPAVYQFAVKRRHGNMVGTAHMDGADNVKQFWIQDQTLIAPNTISGQGGLGSKAILYNYPAGGKAIKKIAKGVIDAQGAVVSLAAK